MADQPSDGDLFRGAIAPPPPPEPVAETPPAPAEPPTPIAVEPQATPPAAPTPGAPSPEPTIPPWRLREEAEARRQAEERARLLEGRLNEIASHIRQNQKQPDFFENPDQATQALILRTLQPYAEEQRKYQMSMAKMVAGLKHGDDKVEEAERAFLEARESQTLDPVDYERVVQSPNRYDAVVKWHRDKAVLASVGSDPRAWFDKELENRLASDPQFQAKMLERIRAGAAARPAVTSIPPSLSRATAAASNGGGSGPRTIDEISDSQLFANAMKR